MVSASIAPALIGHCPLLCAYSTISSLILPCTCLARPTQQLGCTPAFSPTFKPSTCPVFVLDIAGYSDLLFPGDLFGFPHFQVNSPTKSPSRGI
ncbi:hypothetical protein BJX66DRAFT_72345 [Aspergillus keveii]|uniref:Secreted protein n=1 Tax=Aspergillus keveii TaxID=714993 RepID=A0ABR4GFW5_9EURO